MYEFVGVLTGGRGWDVHDPSQPDGRLAEVLSELEGQVVRVIVMPVSGGYGVVSGGVSSTATGNTSPIGGGVLNDDEGTPSVTSVNDVSCILVLEKLLGVGHEIAEALYNAGYYSLDDLREARDVDLIRIPGIGKVTLGRIRRQL